MRENIAFINLIVTDAHTIVFSSAEHQCPFSMGPSDDIISNENLFFFMFGRMGHNKCVKILLS